MQGERDKEKKSKKKTKCVYDAQFGIKTHLRIHVPRYESTCIAFARSREQKDASTTVVCSQVFIANIRIRDIERVFRASSKVRNSHSVFFCVGYFIRFSSSI